MIAFMDSRKPGYTEAFELFAYCFVLGNKVALGLERPQKYWAGDDRQGWYDLGYMCAVNGMVFTSVVADSTAPHPELDKLNLAIASITLLLNSGKG